jgi:hypothetical protein
MVFVSGGYTLVFVAVLATVMMTKAQFYMYTPGESIESLVKTQFDSFGGGKRCTPPKSNEPCFQSPYFDSTLCHNDPDNVSMTPWIDPANIIGAPTDSGTIRILCGRGVVPNVVNDILVFTSNGTLPDIFSTPLIGAGGSKALFDVPFSPSNPFPVIVARCIEPGKLPSRIAYARRINWVSAVNGSYCPQHDTALTYRELDLPRCLPSLVGSQCDGQTIVAMPQQAPPPTVPATSSAGSTPHTSGTTMGEGAIGNSYAEVKVYLFVLWANFMACVWLY